MIMLVLQIGEIEERFVELWQQHPAFFMFPQGIIIKDESYSQHASFLVTPHKRQKTVGGFGLSFVLSFPIYYPLHLSLTP